MAAKEVVMSREGLDKLKAELEEFKTVRREEVKEKIDFIPVDNIKDVFDIALCEHIEIKASEEYQNNDIYFADSDIHSEAEVVH